MTASDLYRALKDYKAVFEKYGFVPSGKKAYLSPEHVKLEIVPEKWGWIPGEGARFLMRLYDLDRVIDSYGNILPDDQYDITPHALVRSGRLNDEHIQALTENQPSAVKENLHDGPWFQYSSEEHLRRLLDKTLPLILDEAKEWTAGRAEARKKPIQIQRTTKEQFKALQAEADKSSGQVRSDA